MTNRPLPTAGATPGTTSISDSSGDWRNRAECLGEDPELFYPVGTTGLALLQIAAAKAVCRRCPVMEDCRRWALEMREADGVWGGLSEDERRSINRRNGRLRHLAPKPTPPPQPAPAKKPRTARPDSDSHCGTLYGYQRHRERKDAACDPCKAAKATDSADRRRRQRGGQAA